MPSLFVPGEAARAVLAEGEAKRMMDFQRRLGALDERLGLFLCERPVEELRQGFWYVTRRNDNGTFAFWEVSNPDGSYREPAEDVIEEFRRMDRHTLQDMRDEREAKRRADQKAAEREREENKGRAQELADYTFRVQHRIPKQVT